MKLNYHDHVAKIDAIRFLSEGIKFKDESASCLNADEAAALAHKACNAYHSAINLLNHHPVIADGLSTHTHMYELKQFARRWGY